MYTILSEIDSINAILLDKIVYFCTNYLIYYEEYNFRIIFSFDWK